MLQVMKINACKIKWPSEIAKLNSGGNVVLDGTHKYGLEQLISGCSIVHNYAPLLMCCYVFRLLEKMRFTKILVIYIDMDMCVLCALCCSGLDSTVRGY